MLFSSRDLLRSILRKRRGRRTTVPTPTFDKAFDTRTGFDWPGPATCSVQDNKESLLAAELEELARLRLSIVLTAKWEADRDEEEERRKELRGELENLRHWYFEKIDHIAMPFGVAEAMKAKEQVEGGVTLPPRGEMADFPDDTHFPAGKDHFSI
jgi:hypothetical protein